MKLLATECQRVLYEAREIWRAGFVTFDTETTGLAEWDEIIQWAVCSQDGTVLGSGYIKPTIEISMDAQEIHGISEEQVADAPTFEQAWPQIRDLLKGQTVVIYNADFDIRLLWQSAEPYKIDLYEPLISTIKTHCAMELFARFYGEIHDYYGTYVWQKLDMVAIPHLQIDVPGEPHHADYDAAATAMVIKKLAELADQELPAGWHPPVYVKCAGGCGGSMERAEADEVWYCAPCGVKVGIFHKCVCARVLERPTTGIACEDLCEVCLEKLEQERMLLIGEWHWCSGKYCSWPNIVQSSDLEETCEHCQRQTKWKRQAEEKERERQERMARERKDAKRRSNQAYRDRQKKLKQENAERAAQGLPPLEPPKRPEPEQEFTDNGHHFTRGKDNQGLPIVTCSLCLQTWRRPPVAHCLKLPTFSGWEAKPTDWHTKTALGRLKLQADWGKPDGYVVTMKDTYRVYSIDHCKPIEKSHAASQ